MEFEYYLQQDYDVRRREFYRILEKRDGLSSNLSGAEREIYDYELQLERCGQGFKP